MLLKFFRAPLLLAALMLASPVFAQDIVTRTKKADFDDVRMDLNNAILETGVTIQSQGNIAAMLGRTAADLGATEVVYSRAEFIAICSAHFSRKLMEADPTNLAFCPFSVFIYEAKAKAGEIVVGFRPLTVPASQGATAKASAAEINALLTRIVDAAVK